MCLGSILGEGGNLNIWGKGGKDPNILRGPAGAVSIFLPALVRTYNAGLSFALLFLFLLGH
jgi:hypothetical protein